MLRVEALEVAYGEIPALMGVALEVGRGEIVALLGNNGAGKKTTLKAVSGLLRPRPGVIALQGESLGGCRPTRPRARQRSARHLRSPPEWRVPR